MYNNNQTDRERRACWREVMTVFAVVAVLWGISLLLTAAPPTTTSITHEVLSQASLSALERQWVLVSLNETLYADMTLMNRPGEYREHLEYLVAQVQ